jgi:predicted nucleic acid-binding protein
MAFLLDTNIVSELRKRSRCSPQVRLWFAATPAEDIYLSVVVLGELRRGIDQVRGRDPTTARVLDSWYAGLKLAHEDRILSVTLKICELWGSNPLLWPLQTADALIAATAQHYGLTVATRNERDFQRCGVDYFNPFRA